MQELYIGLMSGTSMDAVDAVLVNFSEPNPALLASYSEPLPTSLRQELIALCEPGNNEINRLGELDVQIGRLFAQTAINLLAQTSLSINRIQAIGSHGQTIRHQPVGNHRFTLQIGDPNIIAEQTGITTVADFRRRDMAAGGQGAPLAPAFHNAIFRNDREDHIFLNLGGIANITYLPANAALPVIGFDTGPANTLLDAWANQHLGQSYDKNGAWGKSGEIDEHLLTVLLNDAYFKLPSPKSTGREYFNLAWLKYYLADLPIAPQNVQATLVELTAITIAQAIHRHTSQGTILIGGGGINNIHLIERLNKHCVNFTITSTESFGVHPQWIEAMAFAWLAKQTLAKKAGNLSSVTGAQNEAILGGIYLA